MNTYLVHCQEIRTFIVEVPAESVDHARELINEDVNKYEVIQEGVLDWEIDLIEDI